MSEVKCTIKILRYTLEKCLLGPRVKIKNNIYINIFLFTIDQVLFYCLLCLIFYPVLSADYCNMYIIMDVHC